MKWIDVKNKLPEINKPVLLKTDKGIIEGWLFSEDENDIEWSFITLQIHGCGCCGRDDDKVTHWAEIPELPQLIDTTEKEYQNVLKYL